jgi:hypothetical protein
MEMTLPPMADRLRDQARWIEKSLIAPFFLFFFLAGPRFRCQGRESREADKGGSQGRLSRLSRGAVKGVKGGCQGWSKARSQDGGNHAVSEAKGEPIGTV